MARIVSTNSSNLANTSHANTTAASGRERKHRRAHQTALLRAERHPADDGTGRGGDDDQRPAIARLSLGPGGREARGHPSVPLRFATRRERFEPDPFPFVEVGWYVYA